MCSLTSKPVQTRIAAITTLLYVHHNKLHFKKGVSLFILENLTTFLLTDILNMSFTQENFTSNETIDSTVMGDGSM